MKAFFVKNRRLILLAVPFILYIIYSISINSIAYDTVFKSTITSLDSYIPFVDFMVYGYVTWIILASASLLFLFSCLGDGYYRLIIALSISVVLCIITYLSFPVKMEIPDFGSSSFLNSLLPKQGIASFPNMPSAILFNSFFFILLNRKKHDHSKCMIAVIAIGIILILWVVCALFSKTVYILDLSFGILTGIISSLIASFIPSRSSH